MDKKEAEEIVQKNARFFGEGDYRLFHGGKTYRGREPFDLTIKLLAEGTDLPQDAILLWGGIHVSRVSVLAFTDKGKNFAIFQEKGKIVQEGQPRMYRLYGFDREKMARLTALLKEIREIEEELVDMRSA